MKKTKALVFPSWYYFFASFIICAYIVSLGALFAGIYMRLPLYQRSLQDAFLTMDSNLLLVISASFLLPLCLITVGFLIKYTLFTKKYDDMEIKISELDEAMMQHDMKKISHILDKKLTQFDNQLSTFQNFAVQQFSYVKDHQRTTQTALHQLNAQLDNHKAFFQKTLEDQKALLTHHFKELQHNLSHREGLNQEKPIANKLIPIALMNPNITQKANEFTATKETLTVDDTEANQKGDILSIQKRLEKITQGMMNQLPNQAHNNKKEESKVTNLATNDKTIQDQLINISIDIARLMELSTNSKDWQQYFNGQKTIFLASLNGFLSQQGLDKAKELYKNNDQFRLFLDKYLETYHQVIDSGVLKGTDFELNYHHFVTISQVFNMDNVKII